MNIPSPKRRSPAKAHGEDAESDETAAREDLNVACKLCVQVSTLVGVSPEMVFVRRLWLRRFRVNVIAPGPKSRILQSYFICANQQGEIVKSDPPLPQRSQSRSTG